MNRPSTISARAVNSTLIDVAADEGGVYAVGERGIFIASADGVDWIQLALPTSVSLTSVKLDRKGNLWVLGHSGILLQSPDRGRSWSRILDGNKVNELVRANAAERVAEGLPNSEGQLRDAENLARGGPSNPLFDMHFADDETALISGAYGILLRSTDAGKSWKSITYDVDNPEGRHLYRFVSSPAANVFHVVGESGLILRTEDGGASFERLNLPYEGTLFAGLSPSGDELLALGLRGNAFYTSDKGSSWRKCDMPNVMTLTSATMGEPGEFIVADETGRLFKSNHPCDGYKTVNIPQMPLITGMGLWGISGRKSLVISTDRGIREIKQEQLRVGE